MGPVLFLSKHNYLFYKCNPNALGQLCCSTTALLQQGCPQLQRPEALGSSVSSVTQRTAGSLQRPSEGFVPTKHRSPGFARATSRLRARQAKPAPSPQPGPALWQCALVTGAAAAPSLGSPRLAGPAATCLAPLAVPRQLYLEMPMHWCQHLKWACSGVPRLAVLPGSSHSNPLFHFSGLSFWHSEKHHLKLITAPYFAPNCSATDPVHYALCRVGVHVSKVLVVVLPKLRDEEMSAG